MHHSYMEANRHQTPLLECNHHLSKLVAPTDAERVWSHTLISFNVIAQVFPHSVFSVKPHLSILAKPVSSHITFLV